MQQIEIAINRKRLQISTRKPGVIQQGDPKIIYTMMQRRNERFRAGSKMEVICSIRPKFNDILNDAVAGVNQYILSIRSCCLKDHFDHWGSYLSYKGKIDFWSEMDELLERFDNNQVKLHLKTQSRRKMYNNNFRK